MGQIVSDVTEVLNYKKSKKEAKSKRQEILQQMADDEATKINLVKNKKALKIDIIVTILVLYKKLSIK